MHWMSRSIRMLSGVVLLSLILAACGQQADTGAAPTSAPGGAAVGATEPLPTTDTSGGVTATEAAVAPEATVTGTTQPQATSAPAEGGAAGGATIKVGSKDFTEEFIVAEMYALLLENAGFTVERKLNLGGTPIAHQALLNNDIDLYPEYTSTGLQEVLKNTETFTSGQEVYETVKQGYEEQFNVTWLEPAPFNNSNTFAVTQETAQQYNLKTFSDLFANAAELRLGGPAEFPERADTQHLEQVYGADISNFKEFRQLGTGPLRYDALQSGEVDVIVAFGTDGRIGSDNLVVLQDDKGAYPIYQIAPVVRQDVLDANPTIADTLNQLAPLLTDKTMAELNAKVDVDGEEYEAVAEQFLKEQGLIQ